MKLERKKKVFFLRLRGFPKTYKLGKLILRKSYTNIFLTLTDLTGQVIKCLTSGEVIKGYRSNSKRRKTTPQAIEILMREMVKILDLYVITHVWIVMRFKVNIFTRFLIKELKFHNIGIRNISQQRKKAHNGMRGRKLRRK